MEHVPIVNETQQQPTIDQLVYGDMEVFQDVDELLDRAHNLSSTTFADFETEGKCEHPCFNGEKKFERT